MTARPEVLNAPLTNVDGSAGEFVYSSARLESEEAPTYEYRGSAAPKAGAPCLVEEVERLAQRRYVDKILNVDPRNVKHLTRPELQVMRFRLAQLLKRARASQRLLDGEAASRGLEDVTQGEAV